MATAAPCTQHPAEPCNKASCKGLAVIVGDAVSAGEAGDGRSYSRAKFNCKDYAGHEALRASILDLLLRGRGNWGDLVRLGSSGQIWGV